MEIKVDEGKRNSKHMKLEISILNAANQTCGTIRNNSRTKQTSWWNQEIQTQIQTKKKLWKQYLSKGKDNNYYQRYKEQRKRVEDMVIQAKQKSWEKFGATLEKNSEGNQKLLYRVLKNLRKNK